MQRLLVALAALALLTLPGAAQQRGEPSPAQAQGMRYEEESPPILERLPLRQLRGQARDRMGNAISGLLLGLYTDASPHQLLAATETDAHGNFDFGRRLPAGNYRLIAKYPGLCTANIPVAVTTQTRHSHLELRMEYPGLDVCSSAQVK